MPEFTDLACCDKTPGSGASRYGQTRYKTAIELYSTTDMPVKTICEQAGVSISAFRAYVRRWHRELMFARYGINISPEEARNTPIRKPRGQSDIIRAKYSDAISACADEAYLDCNVCQIALMFKLNPSALSHQLRKYYPEIIDWRERERLIRGLNDNLHRGVKSWCKQQYSEAVNYLRASDDTIRNAAAIFNLSYSGLREHLLSYHVDLLENRSEKRKNAKGNKTHGALTGNGTRHIPTYRQNKRYEEATRLYQCTSMTQKDVAAVTGVTPTGLGNYLRMWRRDLIFEHRGITHVDIESISLSETKHYHKSAAAKYAAAIELLKSTKRSTASVARQFGLNPDVFREYLHEHEPTLAGQLGMTRTPEGKLVSAQSLGKYAEAIHEYQTTTEPLKSIARRFGLKYNSLGGFIRRNRPDAIISHNLLVEEETKSLRKNAFTEAADKVRMNEAKEKERILDALKHTGNNRTQAAQMLGICKSSFYNKLKAFNIILSDGR